MPNTSVLAPGEAMPKNLTLRINDVIDLLANVRYFNEAMFLAAEGLATVEHTNAFQAIADVIDSKLVLVRDQLDAIVEELAS